MWKEPCRLETAFKITSDPGFEFVESHKALEENRLVGLGQFVEFAKVMEAKMADGANASVAVINESAKNDYPVEYPVTWPEVKMFRPAVRSNFVRGYSVAHSIWDGEIVNVSDQGFSAILRKSDGGLGDEIEMDFDINDISEAERDLVVPGAMFIWTLARETSRTGQIRNVDVITFRRFPRWNFKENKKMSERANELFSFFSKE